MRKIVVATGLMSATMLLSACGSTGLFNRDRPDEFAVSRQAPLVVPPDFALMPPKPGAAPAVTTDSQKQAMEALFGGPASRSASENAVMQGAGSADAVPGIRSNVGDPGTNVVDTGQTVNDIVSAPEGDGQNARAATPQ